MRQSKYQFTVTKIARPLNGALFWRGGADVDPRCPYCGEERLIDLDDQRRLFWCDVCARSWPVPAGIVIARRSAH
jgi:hypothetical protein